MVERGLENGLPVRDDRWSESIAVGSRSFVEKVKNELGLKRGQFKLFQWFNRFAPFKSFRSEHQLRTSEVEADGTYALREPTNRREARGNRQQ